MASARFSSGSKVRPQQLGFFRVQLEDGGGGPVRDEILVAIEQPQRVHRGGIAIVVAVALFELRARLVIETQAHQIDAELRARAPEIRLMVERLAVIAMPSS